MDSLKTDPRPPFYSVGRWLAPECTDAPYALTMKSDVFALGMVLWELSHRTLPFPEISKEEDVIKAIKHDKQRPKIAPVSARDLSGGWGEEEVQNMGSIYK
jgi:hypothetical protein